MRRKLMYVGVLIFAISLVLVFTTAGAKREGKPADEEKPEFVNVQGYDVRVPWDKEPHEIEIVALYLNVTHPFASKLEAGAIAATEKWGVNGYQTGSDNWGSEDQFKTMETLIEKRVDGISVAIADMAALDPLVQKALAAHIPVTTYNVDSADSGRFSYVGQDLFSAGASTAEQIMIKLEEKGVVDDPSKSRSGDHIKILVTDPAPELYADIERFRGVMDVLDRYDNIEVIGPIAARGSDEEAYAVIENLFFAHPDADGVIDMGALLHLWGRFFKEQDMGNDLSDDPIYVTGHDILEELLIDISDGWVTATVGQDPYLQGFNAIGQLAEFCLTGNPDVFKTIGVPDVIVDINNAADFLKRMRAGEPIG